MFSSSLLRIVLSCGYNFVYPKIAQEQ